MYSLQVKISLKSALTFLTFKTVSFVPGKLCNVSKVILSLLGLYVVKYFDFAANICSSSCYNCLVLLID